MISRAEPRVERWTGQDSQVSQVDTSKERVESSQVESRRVESSRVESSRVESRIETAGRRVRPIHADRHLLHLARRSFFQRV